MRQSTNSIFRTVLGCCGLLLGVAGIQAAPIIPEPRSFPEAWQNAGYSGEIPTPETILSVRSFGAVGDGTANDQPAVAAAIAALNDDPGVVYFPPGTYRIGSPISVPSGVVLRGHRPADTELRFDFVDHAIRFTGTQTGSWIDVTETAERQTDQMRLADASTFAVGDYALLTQDDDPAWNITDSWAMGSAGQVVKIVEKAGNRVWLDRPLRHDYPALRNPRIRKLSPVRNAGIENIRLSRLLAGDNASRNNRHTVLFSHAVNCWMRGVHSRMAFGSHVSLDYSSGVEITGCFFDAAHEHDGGGSGYGVRFQFRSGECLLENNIFRKLRHAILLQAGPNGNVIGYNYNREGKSDSHPDYASDISLHGNYPYANLFEGNLVEHIWIDNSHDGANGPLNTFFRNQARIAGFNMRDAAADSQNIVGGEFERGSFFFAQIVAGDGYRLAGSDHLTYANESIADGLQPTGTDDLSDFSYYLNEKPTAHPVLPDWWNIPETLPIAGPPLAFSATKTNPAHSRWHSGGRTHGPPSLFAQPESRSAVAGVSVQFSVGAVGSPAAAYQWFKDGVPLPKATTDKLQLTAVAPDDAGSYTCRISDPNGTVLSAPASLDVSDQYTAWATRQNLVGGAFDDDDADGLANLMEYGMGSNPLAPTVLPAARIENGFLELTYRRNKNTPDLSMEVQASGSLTNGWDASTVEQRWQVVDHGDHESITARDTFPTKHAPKRFLRIESILSD